MKANQIKTNQTKVRVILTMTINTGRLLYEESDPTVTHELMLFSNLLLQHVSG